MRVIAYLIVRDEAPVLEELVAHHRREGLEIVAIDNGSTDGTPALLEHLRAQGSILDYETHPTDSYTWSDLVAAGVALAQRFSPDWIVHLDANSFLESNSGRARRLVDDIAEAERGGYNVVQLEVFDFYPTLSDCSRERSVYRRLCYYTPRAKLSRIHEKIFRCCPGLRVSDGHRIEFQSGVEKRVSPIHSVMRHYVFRDQEQGVEKILRRKNRWDKGERRRGSHVQYDGYLGYGTEIVVPASYLHRKAEDTPWRREMLYERPEPLFSEHHDFNSSGWFNRLCQDNTHLCCIIGCQRSGTTLLRLIFEANPQVAVFEEPGSYDHWADRDLLERTVQQGQAAGRRLFVYKVPCLTEQFDASDRTAKELRYRAFPFHLVYDGQLLVFMVRDPRDICLSLQKRKTRSSGNDWIDHWPRYVNELYPRIIPDFSSRYAREVDLMQRAGPYSFAARAALYWKIKTEAYLRYDALGYKLRLVLFEDLVTRPERTLRWLCRFLCIPFHPQMLRHHEQEHKGIGEKGLTVGNTDPRRPIDGAATRLYQGVMPIEEQRVILEIAGDTYRRIQRKWEQQLRNDIIPDLDGLPTGFRN
jgi:hypothetical protein